MKAKELYLSHALRYLIAIIYLQTLYYKFTAHPDSVYIFSTIGLEPYGRIALGCVELVISIMLLFESIAPIGILLSMGVISGAILTHLGPVGIEVKGDGGTLFALAATVWLAGLLYLYLQRMLVQSFIQKIKFQL